MVIPCAAAAAAQMEATRMDKNFIFREKIVPGVFGVRSLLLHVPHLFILSPPRLLSLSGRQRCIGTTPSLILIKFIVACNDSESEMTVHRGKRESKGVERFPRPLRTLCLSFLPPRLWARHMSRS